MESGNEVRGRPLSDLPVQPMRTAASDGAEENATGTTSGPRGLRLTFLRVALAAVVFILCTGAAELALRLLGVKAAPPPAGHPILGFDQLPYVTGRYLFPEYGGYLTIRTNNLGFREDANTWLAKPPLVYRIVVVGDSQTAGECGNSESYPNILERHLNRGSGLLRYEVINAGVGRYSPYQYYLKCKTQLVQLGPDQIVVGFYIGNDLMDLVRRDDRPYLTLEAGGRVVAHPPLYVLVRDPATGPTWLETSRLYAKGREVLGPTLFYQVTRTRMLLLNATESGQGLGRVARYMASVKRLTDISLGLMTQSLLQTLWFQRFPSTLPTAFALNRHVMSRFKDICDNNRIRLTYVLIPTKPRIEPEDLPAVLKKVAEYDPGMTLSKMRQFEDMITERVIKDCRELAIECVDLRRPMLERKQGRGLYYPEEMHLSPAGNQLIGEILAELPATPLAVGTH
jgi:hypothetical protein